jgi:1-acyl-sn-glycerol-3-phosphate acyltransferase
VPVNNNPAAYSRREGDLAFRFLKAGAVCFSRIYHSLEVRQHCILPRKGPAILVCNHTSSLDPLLIQSVSPRLIRWMMAKEYFQYSLLRWVFKSVGVILVERSGRDMAATRAAMRVLEAGYVLGVFPEGKIETSAALLPFQSGIGLLAMRTGAAVYPAYLDGNQRGREMIEAFLRPSRASIAFAPPVDLRGLCDSRKDLDQATQRIQTAVEKIKLTIPSRRP